MPMNPRFLVRPLAVLAFALVALLLWWSAFRHGDESRPNSASKETVATPNSPGTDSLSASIGHRSKRRPQHSPEELVVSKVRQFASQRRALFFQLAQRLGGSVPPEVERFFAAAEAGDWDQLQSLYQTLAELRTVEPRPEPLNTLWRALQETYGVAEQARLWPAQQLLDYGNDILQSLRPGSVYLGGSDAGCFIPLLLNETSGQASHLMLTQNALADATYAKYLGLVHGDRFSALDSGDAEAAFNRYLTDARERLTEGKRRPGEQVELSADGRLSLGGQVSVMAINELLLQALLVKNPNIPFALEESFPLTSLYAEATPRGPILELGMPEDAAAFDSTAADNTTDYWRKTVDQLLQNPSVATSPDALKAHAVLALAQARLLDHRQFSEQAEQTYRLVSQLTPENPAAVLGIAGIMARTDRGAEGRALIDAFLRAHPQHRAGVEASTAYAALNPR